MLHTILYQGWFDQSFERFKAGNLDYARKKDGRWAVVDKPSDKVDGIILGYMQDAEGFVAVRAGNVILVEPVRLVPERHTDGKRFLKAPLFGDVAAQALLKDMMDKNPNQKDRLQALYNRVFGTEKQNAPGAPLPEAKITRCRVRPGSSQSPHRWSPVLRRKDVLFCLGRMAWPEEFPLGHRSSSRQSHSDGGEAGGAWPSRKF